jgi:hypothetical protein
VSIPDLERVVFFNGQSLAAADLTALETSNRELRWLHNSSLHNWGIAAGFDVQGQSGDTSVTVQPGYGLDDQGREIILTRAVTKAIPAVAGAASGSGPAIFYITASYLDDTQETVLQNSPGVCLPSGTVRLSNQPAIEWRTLAQLRDGLDLVLGQASIKNCQLSSAISGAPRRYARACVLPYLRSGSTYPLKPKWELWQPSGHPALGFTAVIDTSGASFQSTPRYSVQIIGPRATTWQSKPIQVLDLASIAAPSSTAFTLQVALPALIHANPGEVRDATTGPEILDQLDWAVVWIGVEN